MNPKPRSEFHIFKYMGSNTIFLGAWRGSLARSDLIAGWQAEGGSKVCQRAPPKILEAQQCFVGCFPDLSDSLQALGRQSVADTLGNERFRSGCRPAIRASGRLGVARSIFAFRTLR